MKNIPAPFKNLPYYKDAPNILHMTEAHVDVVLPRYAAGEEFDTHHHDTHNCGLILLGEMLLTINGNEKCYRAGDWYDIPAHAPHSSRFEQDTQSIEFYFKPTTKK